MSLGLLRRAATRDLCERRIAHGQVEEDLSADARCGTEDAAGGSSGDDVQPGRDAMRSQIDSTSPSGGSEQPRFKIETIEDYELATQRIATLDASARVEAEERERQALIAAIGHWDRKHDDATGWKDKP